MDHRRLQILAAGRRMTPDELEAGERTLRASPEDIELRLRVIGAHFGLRGDPQRRLAHVIWFVHDRPDVELGMYTVFQGSQQTAELDRAWREVIAPASASTAHLRGACAFFALTDHALAMQLAARGAAREPTSSWWPGQSAWLCEYRMTRSEDPVQRDQLARQIVQHAERAIVLDGDPDSRYRTLIRLATAAVEAGELERATRAADELLANRAGLAYRSLEAHGVHTGHVVLGRVALARRDLAAAIQCLHAAGTSPACEIDDPDYTLAARLLAAEEAAAVLQYLAHCKRLQPKDAFHLDRWIQTIHDGRVPSWKSYASGSNRA